MSDTEDDVALSVKIVLVGAAMLGFILPSLGLSFWPSVLTVAIVAYAVVAFERSRALARKKRPGTAEHKS